MLYSSSPANKFMPKVNNRNTKKRCKLNQLRYQDEVIDINLLSSLLTLNIFNTYSGVYIVDLDQARTLYKKDNYLYFLLLYKACNTA